MSKHTATPWKSCPGGTDVTSRIHTADDSDWVAQTFAGSNNRADADHIVHCVNHFDEMLAALKHARHRIEKFKSTGMSDEAFTLPIIEEAIAKAEGRKS